jgi:hypothetical protein
MLLELYLNFIYFILEFLDVIMRTKDYGFLKDSMKLTNWNNCSKKPYNLQEFILTDPYFLELFQMTEKTVKAKSSIPASDDTYPEIEKFFPFNPLGCIFW